MSLSNQGGMLVSLDVSGLTESQQRWMDLPQFTGNDPHTEAFVRRGWGHLKAIRPDPVPTYSERILAFIHQPWRRTIYIGTLRRLGPVRFLWLINRINSAREYSALWSYRLCGLIRG